MENRKKNKDKEMSLIIYSCWKNRDMWNVFSILFKKYWPDCPYKILLVTDAYHDEGLEYVFDEIVIRDSTWAVMIKEAVCREETKYVMLWMDDYLLCDYVSNHEIKKQLLKAQKYHAGNLRLIESPICSGFYKNDKNTGYYKKGEAYCLSTQAGIWDRNFLLRVIRDEWSAWEFERLASVNKKMPEQPLLVSLDYVLPYEEGVRRGRWMRGGVNLCRRNGIYIDPEIRPVMTNMEMAVIYFLGAVLDWNPLLIVKIQNLIYGGSRKLKSWRKVLRLK